MGEKDIISKSIVQRIVRDFATYLFDLPVDEVELLDGEKQRIEDRRAYASMWACWKYWRPTAIWIWI